MAQFFKKMALTALQQGVPMLFRMGQSYVESSIELKQDEMNREAIEQNLRTISKIDKQILSQGKMKIPGFDLTKEELGRETWKKMRENIMGLPPDATESQVREVMAKNYEMISQYPCMDCREHGMQFANDINFAKASTRNEGMLKTWELQNKVNVRLEKPIFPYEEFKNQYGL